MRKFYNDVFHTGAPFVYVTLLWSYRCSYQKIFQASRSLVGHKRCIRYRFLHFFSETRRVGRWSQRIFGRLGNLGWYATTRGTLCVLLCSLGVNAMFLFTLEAQSICSCTTNSQYPPFDQMMFKLLCSFVKSFVV